MQHGIAKQTRLLSKITSTEADNQASPVQVIQSYHLQERADLVTLIHQYEPDTKLDDLTAFERRLRGIQLLASVCSRQDTRRDLPKRSTASLLNPTPLWPDEKSNDNKEDFPMICKPRQCVWCLGDTRKPYQARTFEYSRINKLLDEADKHLRPYASDDEVPCPDPVCKVVEKVLANKVHFKSHLARDHGIYLRACH